MRLCGQLCVSEHAAQVRPPRPGLLVDAAQPRIARAQTSRRRPALGVWWALALALLHLWESGAWIVCMLMRFGTVWLGS